MRTVADIQADIDSSELKKIRPLTDAVISGGTNAAAIVRLRDIESVIATLRVELAEAVAVDAAANAAAIEAAKTVSA